MKCILMHKNVPVADVEFDEITGAYTKIYDVINPLHLPVGVQMRNGTADRRDLHEWWSARSIPSSRSGLKDALEKLDVASAAEMLGKSFGLNLSDQYWILPETINVCWNDINFFENDFSEDIGNILIGIGESSDRINYMSPDIASDGWLKKKWRIADGKRVLYKAGSGSYLQEPYNEVLATAIMKRLDIPCAEYTLTLIGDKPFCACGDFVTTQTELVTAHNIIKSEKKPNNKSLYEHYIDCCKERGISDIKDTVNRMLTLDYIIVNEDRHLNNFGLIRNAETLEYISAAPVYDSGTSMWFNIPTQNIKAGARDIGSKPFKTNHDDQIRLVDDFSWLDFDKLKGIDEEFAGILENAPQIDEQRRDVLCNTLNMRIEMLKNIVEHSVKYTNLKSIGMEVEEDIAYSGNDDGMTLQ